MRQASGGLPAVLIALDIGCLVCLFLSADKAAADGAPPPSQDTMSNQEAWCPLQARSGFALPSPGPYWLQGHMPRGLATIEEGGTHWPGSQGSGSNSAPSALVLSPYLSVPIPTHTMRFHQKEWPGMARSVPSSPKPVKKH